MDSCSCAFEHNGRFLAFLTPDGRLKVWDCTTGFLKYEYTPPSHLSTACTCLQWSWTSRGTVTPRRKRQKTAKQCGYTDADSIALGTSSGDVLIYDVSAGEVNKKLEGGHESRVNDICWSENDITLYSSSNDKHISEWDTESCQRKCKWKADKHGVTCIRLGPKGHTLLSAGRSIKLWDLETKQILQSFTGHSSRVRHLLFVPSPLSHDSNANHVPTNRIINGLYFISGAEQDRLMNIWLVNLESDNKNALVSLSLTDEPIAVDVLRYSNCAKPVHIAVVSKDGQLHIFEYSLNGSGKKPLTPTRSIQLASASQKGETPSPIPIMCAQLSFKDDPSVMIAFGSVAKPRFETLTYSTMEKHTCLIREDTSNLLLKRASHPPLQVDKGQRSHEHVTLLGPVNMALPTPSVASENGKARTGNKTAEKTSSSVEEQSIEDRLKSINAAASEVKSGRKAGPPMAGSLVQMLVQALHSQDNILMEDVLRSSSKESVIKNTVKRLPANLVVPLITELVNKTQASPGRGGHLILWIQQILGTHMAYLMTVPDLVESLSGLYTMMESRVSVFTKLCKLRGRLDLILSQVDSQNQTAAEGGELTEPSVVFQEEDSEEEPAVLRETDHSDSDANWEEEMASESESEIESEDNNKGEDEENEKSNVN